MAARLPKGSPVPILLSQDSPSEREIAENPLGVHLVASIDADLYQGLVRYCAAREIPLSRAVNNALSLYFTGRPRSEKPRRGRSQKFPMVSRVGAKACPSQGEDVDKDPPSTRKIPISVHVDVDLAVLAEEYCAAYRVHLSSVVNRALALWLHRGPSRSTSTSTLPSCR